MMELDDYTVKDGKIIKEVPVARLDDVLSRNTERIARLNKRIAELVELRNKAQSVIDRVNALKGELRK